MIQLFNNIVAYKFYFRKFLYLLHDVDNIDLVHSVCHCNDKINTMQDI